MVCLGKAHIAICVVCQADAMEVMVEATVTNSESGECCVTDTGVDVAPWWLFSVVSVLAKCCVLECCCEVCVPEFVI